MRKITKLLTLALAALMIMGAMPVSAAFTDVSVENEALYEAVELLSTLGVAKGTTDTTFGPEELVTRQQMAAFVYRLMKAGRSSEGGVNTTPFTDLKDSTFFNMVSWAANAGIIKGTSATTFNPTGNITLQDAYVMVVRALGYEKDGALVYPHGYVDQAEAIGLDEDIPSTVDYTDNLNRGQVAIILANAFYADMNETVVDYEWIGNPNTKDQDGNFTDYQYAAVEKTETIAHKIFGVEEEKLVVTATAHYAFGGAETTWGETKDIDTVYGVRYEEDGNKLAAAEYDMADLGLEGSSDDYFMAEITLFTKKAEDTEDDVIIAAKSNLVKKTVTAKDVVLERSAKTEKDYYVGQDKKNEKVMTGYVEFAGIKAYLDIENAPFSYTKLDTADGNDKGSVKFIELKSGAYDEENATFAYDFVADTNFDGLYKEEVADGYVYDVLSTTFADKFPTVYTNGLYEADVYDVNGDGYAEYVFVKNYDFFQVADKKSTSFRIVDGVLKIKDAEGTIEGVEVKDDDYVLGYFNAAAKYAKIAEVIAPINEMVTTTSYVEGKTSTATFENGTVVEFVDADLKFEDAVTENPFTAGKTYKVYVKDDVVLYTAANGSTEFDADADYAIILPVEEGEDYIITTSSVADGEYKESFFVKVVINGAVKTVKLADYINLYEGEGEERTLDSKKITEKAVAEEAVATLAGKFSTFTLTSSNAYTFTATDFVEAADEDVNVKELFADKEDETAIYFEEDSAKFEHFTGSIYKVTGIADVERFNIKDYSKLIIKSYDEDEEEYVYTVYNASNLSKFAETTFTGVKAVFINNIKSDIVEDLGILFAEVDEFASNETKDYRKIIGTSKVAVDGKSEDVYTILNLKDGTKTANVKAAGDATGLSGYVVLDEAGEIKAATAKTAYEENVLFTATFKTYDADNRFLDINDGKTYIIDEDATVLVYIDSDEYFVAGVDALTVDEDEVAYDELEGVTALELHMIGTDDEDSDAIRHINTIVVYPTIG